MKNNIVIIGILIILTFVGFSGCFGEESNSELNKFIGTWKHGTLKDGGTIIFYSDGNCNYNFDSAKWELKNNKLIINLTDLRITLTFNYTFLDNNQILELVNVENGIMDDYRKQ